MHKHSLIAVHESSVCTHELSYLKILENMLALFVRRKSLKLWRDEGSSCHVVERFEHFMKSFNTEFDSNLTLMEVESVSSGANLWEVGLGVPFPAAVVLRIYWMSVWPNRISTRLFSHLQAGLNSKTWQYEKSENIINSMIRSHTYN